MKKKQKTEYIILGSLMASPMHGYEIRRFLYDHIEFIWHISTSQLYVLLQKLEDQGLLSSFKSSQENRPPKKIYRITSKGQTRFLTWVHSPTPHVRDLRIEFLSKLLFFKHLKITGGTHLVQSQINLLEALREKNEIDQVRHKDAFAKVVLGFKRSQFEVCLDWLNKEVEPFLRDIG